ncbi:MAG: hypothetical protein AB1458_14990, partial [Bacteroidota bacterium]
YKEAIGVVKQSIAVFESLGSRQGVALRLSSLGKAYFFNGEKQKAFDAFKKGYELARTTGYWGALQESMDGLLSYYEDAGDYRNAFFIQKEYHRLNDSISNAEKATQLSAQQQAFEMRQQEKIQKLMDEKKESEHRAEIRQQAIITWSVIIGLLLVIVFSFFLFSRYRVTQRQKSIIEEQKKIVEEKNKDILDSIHYAQRIQQSLLPTDKYIHKSLSRLGTDRSIR